MTDIDPQQAADFLAQQAAKIMPPTPVPSIWDIDISEAYTTAEGEPLVQVQISTPNGIAVHFLKQDAARKIGVDLQAKGSEKRLLRAI